MDDTYDLSPSKRTLRSLKSDVTPIAAVKELVDNVIDNWRRLGDDETDVTIDIDVDFENNTFRIEDDSGGLSEENVKKIFALGGSTKEEIAYSIGSYGMGAKKAIVRLGSNAEIKSRSIGADQGYGFEITEEWLDESSWTVEKEVYNDLQPGSTVIKISDLNIEFTEDEQGDDDESERSSAIESPDAFIEDLKEDLTETYTEFLMGRAGPQDGELIVKVNGRQIDSPEVVNWSFTPVDGYHPRYYKEYEIRPEELPNRDEPVKVDVITGIMPKGEMDKSGTDIYVQNRRILTANKEMMGGWGTEHLKNHVDNIARIRLVLKIYAENNPEDLPWDTQKGRIEINDAIADRAFHFLGRTAGEYVKARYDAFPTPYTTPYGPDSNTLPRSHPELLDYSSQKNVVDKPDSSFEQKEQIERLAIFHAHLGISAENLLTPVYRPSYKAQLDDLSEDDLGEGLGEIDLESLWTVPNSVHNYPEKRLHLWLDVVSQTAERHAEAGIRIQFNGDNPWWRSYYETCIDRTNPGAEELTYSETKVQVDNSVESRIESGDIPDLILEDKELRANELWSIKEAESEADEEEGNTLEEDDIDEDREEYAEAEEAETPESVPSEDEENESEGEDGSTPPDFGSSVGRDVRRSTENRKRIVITVSPPSYEQICNELDLEAESASPREVGEAIAEQDFEIHPFLEPNPGAEAE